MKKILSMFLGLVLLFSIVMPVTSAYAADGTLSGMELNKTAVNNGDGTYTVTLEAYATGSKVISTTSKDIPTDIILVLDQSGSMDNSMGTLAYDTYKSDDSWNHNNKNSNLYNYRHNGGRENLWYRIDEDTFVSVSVTKEEYGTYGYTELSSWTNNSTYKGYSDEGTLYEKVGNEYKKVTVTVSESGWGLDKQYTYTYTFSDGTQVPSSGGLISAPSGRPNLGTHKLYHYELTVDDTKTVYTYSYTESDGNTVILGTSTGADTRFTNPTLYYNYTDSTQSRLEALKEAVKEFVDNVNKKAKGADGEYGTADDINHRIAMVGFASSDSSYNYSQYENTEVFIGSTAYKYGTQASSVYGSAFQSMNTEEGYNNIIASKDALDGEGGTFTNLGMEMANGIFEANPIKAGETRNRVVIVFTDGYPGTSSSVNSTVANNAVSQAYKTKNTYGATVYTVGIFDGANGTPVDSFSGVSNQNKFMHLMSSNYQKAESYSDSNKYGTSTYPKSGSYYLSAGDANTLKNIFSQISSNIESGGSETTLDEDTVIRDIITPQFTLPEDVTASDITLKTYSCTGKVNNEYTWTENKNADGTANTMGATAKITSTDASKDITKNNQVEVMGFDFSENYVGTVTTNGTVQYRGSKLVISFTVTPRDGFMGGNEVITNTSAKIYENAEAEEPVGTFPQPKVNVSTGDIKPEPVDMNVYLGSQTGTTVTDDDVKNNTKFKFGDTILDLSKPNYGLEDWQTEYVDITVTVKDKDGKVVEDFTILDEDVDYEVTVTVTPKVMPGEKTDAKGEPATAKTGNSTGTIHAFVPELTYRDSTVWYGGAAPGSFDGNLTKTRWVHKNASGDVDKVAGDTGVTMLNTEPTLTKEYSYASGAITDGVISTKNDISVDVKVKIGGSDITQYVSFIHTKCDSTCTDPTDGKFWLHVNTCSLKVTKTGGKANESYVFDVYKDGVKYTEVALWGNNSETIAELPVGNYTIKEQSGWSWRYTSEVSGSGALTAENPNGEITCTNTSKTDKWINSFSEIYKNVFGASKSEKKQ